MNLKELRESKKISQVDFSSMFGIPLRTLQHWETGDRIPPPYVGDRLVACLESLGHNDALVVGYLTESAFAVAISKKDAMERARLTWANTMDKRDKFVVAGVYTLEDKINVGLMWDVFAVFK